MPLSCASLVCVCVARRTGEGHAQAAAASGRGESRHLVVVPAGPAQHGQGAAGPVAGARGRRVHDVSSGGQGGAGAPPRVSLVRTSTAAQADTDTACALFLPGLGQSARLEPLACGMRGAQARALNGCFRAALATTPSRGAQAGAGGPQPGAHAAAAALLAAAADAAGHAAEDAGQDAQGQCRLASSSCGLSLAILLLRYQRMHRLSQARRGTHALRKQQRHACGDPRTTSAAAAAGPPQPPRR